MPSVARPVPVEITNAHVNKEQGTGALGPRPAGRKGAGKSAPTAAKLADAYQATVFDLVITSAFTTLDYAQRLINSKTPSEFVELSAIQACKHWGLIIKQAGELGSIAQKLAASDGKRPTAVE